MLKISVIVPNYNHASYLKQRIGSILNQTYQDFELIILDDCSTDNSKEIIEQYRDYPKVKQIVYNTENSGSTFKQWNKGIELSRGEFVWIAESDDFAEPNLLEKLMTGIESDNNIAIAYCQSNRVNTNNIITGTWQTQTDKFGNDFKFDFMMNGRKYVCIEIFA